MWKISTTSMSVFRNLDCLSLVVCSNTTLLKLQSVLFLFFPNSALRNRECGLSMDAAYTRTFTVLLWRRLLVSGWQLLANYAVCPGGGEFDSFFHKSSKSTSYAQPLLPMGLNIDRCITVFIRISATLK